MKDYNKTELRVIYN